MRALYKRLAHHGVKPWLDAEDLLPGQNWEREIQKAILSSNAVLVCLSASSLTKEGFMQREIRMALDIADEKPEGTISIIPARLEDCKLPECLMKWHCVDLFEGDGYARLLSSLRSGATAKPKMNA